MVWTQLIREVAGWNWNRGSRIPDLGSTHQIDPDLWRPAGSRRELDSWADQKEPEGCNYSDVLWLCSSLCLTMVHAWDFQILQVNKVMSILFYVIFLAYLRGIQGNNMDQRSLPEDSLNSLIIKLIQADILKNKLSKQMVDVKENYQSTLPKAEAPREPEQGEATRSEFQPMIATDTELLRQQRRYNSPRVLLSDSTPLEPPPLYLMEDYVGNPVVTNRTSPRRKRYAEHKSHRGEYSVCDSESLWVTDKSSAIDIRGHQVTVLGEIKTGNSPVKQYFYETRCKEARPVKNGCRGIDDKHWNSQCKTSQTYVRALTSENNKLVGWRWIRIDTSCVCALSRKIGRT